MLAIEEANLAIPLLLVLPQPCSGLPSLPQQRQNNTCAPVNNIKDQGFLLCCKWKVVMKCGDQFPKKLSCWVTRSHQFRPSGPSGAWPWPGNMNITEL